MQSCLRLIERTQSLAIFSLARFWVGLSQLRTHRSGLQNRMPLGVRNCKGVSWVSQVRGLPSFPQNLSQLVELHAWSVCSRCGTRLVGLAHGLNGLWCSGSRPRQVHLYFHRKIRHRSRKVAPRRGVEQCSPLRRRLSTPNPWLVLLRARDAGSGDPEPAHRAEVS